MIFIIIILNVVLIAKSMFLLIVDILIVTWITF